ncbi:MAG: TolC family protein [Clostridium sp.]|uniref:TolC family protein n=1 Tax=Clostridium sp. TaxID=1506 RepID=UPI0025BCF66E|nr:TolC family protein [Clostridium sp.]MCE5222335.1 TolC family protein [Clostridium sp.]
MKKAFISSLIMTLMVANISLANIFSVQAATTDNTVATTDNTIKVSLDNIRDIMSENNLDMKVYYNNQQLAKEEYENAKDVTIPDLEAAEKTAQDNYDNFTLAADGLNATDQIKFKTALTSATSALENAQNNLTTLKYNLRSANIEYEQKVEKAVYQAQQDYIKYLSYLSDEQLNEDTVKSQEKVVQVSKLKYDYGFISKNEYTSSLQNNTDSINKYNESKDAEELAKTNLYTTLGISSGEKVTFNTDINEDFAKISKINYNDDLAKMLDNNVDIQLQNIAIDKLNDQIDAETTTTDYTDTIDQYNTDNNQILLKQKMSDAEASFKGQYNILMNSYNSIKSSYDEIIQKQKEYQTIQTKYDYGFASKKEVDDAKLALDNDSSTFNASKNTLYVNYLRYIQMKEGY